MNRDLEIRLGRDILGSPYYASGTVPYTSEALIAACVDIAAEAELPTDIAAFFAQCDRSNEIVRRLRLPRRLPWGESEVAQAMFWMDAGELPPEVPVEITNRDRYPYTDWETPRLIGSIGGDSLFLVGTERDTGSLVVARSPEQEPLELHATYLYELQTHSQDLISITEEI